MIRLKVWGSFVTWAGPFVQINADGGVDSAMVARERCAWKFKEKGYTLIVEIFLVNGPVRLSWKATDQPMINLDKWPSKR